jgi:hypothetical protein
MPIFENQTSFYIAAFVRVYILFYKNEKKKEINGESLSVAQAIEDL